MDDTELHYLAYDPDEIMKEMQTAYIKAGGDALYPGDEREMLLRGVLAVMVQAFAGIDNALRMDTLRYAVRDYLDIYGEKRNCARIEAVAAKATVTVTCNATGYADTLPAGTAMTADGEVYWTLDEAMAMPAAGGSVEAAVTCQTAGSAGNTLTAGTQLQLAVPLVSIGTIVCTTAASGGQDREDDETYRERIRTFGLSAITTGPADRYRASAMAVSSEILDAAALNGGAGVVNVYLLLRDPSQSAALIAAVTAKLSAKDERPLTDTVNVALATAASYTINVEYRTEGGTNVTTAAEEAAASYKEWQEGTIGQAFNPDRLVALLYQAGCTRVVIAEGSAFDGGDCEYTEIAANKYCTGTINLTRVTA